MLGKGWDSDLRIHHMFFRLPPLLLATYGLRLMQGMLYALCSMRFHLTTCALPFTIKNLRYALCFRVASRPKGGPPAC